MTRILTAVVLPALLLLALLAAPASAATTYYVATTGSNSNPGTETSPWATLQHAEDTVAAGDTVIVEDGTYTGHTEFDERWTSEVTFKARNPLRVRLQNNGSISDGGMVVHLNGTTWLQFEGFDVTQNGPSTSDGLMFIDWANSLPTDDITIRDNYFHDAQPSGGGSGDLIKTSNGSHDVFFDGNVFWNPGANEQGLDLNSLVDSEVEGNIFGADYTAATDAKEHIVIKDSGGTADGQVGAENIVVTQNIFLNVDASDSSETWAVGVGADNRSYVEAREVYIRNNLLIGNSTVNTGRPFHVEQAEDVHITHNTLTGDLPVTGQHFLTIRKDNTVVSDNIVLANNVISDPTGTMGTANPSDGSRSVIGGHADAYTNLVFTDNLWFNNGASFPTGGILQHDDDANETVADPLLATSFAGIVFPTFDFATGQFASGEPAGANAIEDEHERLVLAYGDIPSNSPAVGNGNATYCAVVDILDTARGGTCDQGAFEYVAP